MSKTAATRAQRLTDRILVAISSVPLAHVAIISALLFALFAMVALLVPLGSGPDESAHYLYSAAVARGQSGTLDVEVPAAIANIRQLTCLAYQPDLTAACQHLYSGAAAVVGEQSHVGLYNPVFYIWTGLGSLISPNEAGLYFARLLAAVVTAVLTGWGLSYLLRTSRNSWPLVGTLLVFTPMVTYVSAVLNPSSWEIASTLGFTVAAYAVIVRQPVATRWNEAHSLLVVAGSVLLISRGLSPFIAVLIVVALAILAGLSRIRGLLVQRATWIWVCVLAVVGIAAIAWILLHGTNYIGVDPPASLGEGIHDIPVYYEGVWSQVQQVFGLIGWLELMPPNALVLAWVALLIGVVAISYSFSAVRQQIVIGLGALTVLLLPGILAGIQWGGVGWQGRYTIPFILATVVIAGLAASEDAADADAFHRTPRVARTRAQLLVAATVVFGGSQIAMLLITAHRYVVGGSAPLLAAPLWQPPFNFRLLIGVFVVVVILLGWILARTVSARVAATASRSAAVS
ncbi:DUF2142 domain-containing protein [Herbiconiux ginsengi]|uniref:Predicted membrane protein n=1 Tax=Herbiconiux ginsengi TaxID=381665 RepID=A0A1H3STT3_9MICO|nr:DUF2142 domain-containing protein [Herbiconiux ginsengi]SDZ41396.1 Predicted membrane protein [Herbiconiux ginsengi]